MPWTQLDSSDIDRFKELKKDFRREYGFSFEKKTKYFIDENLGPYGVELLRDWGYNVTDVWESNLVGKPDENIWRYCQTERRTILTHDDDFLDNRIYPLRKSFGVVVLPHKDSNDRGLMDKTAHLCSFLSNGVGLIYQTKIIIRENGHWEKFYLDQAGKLTSTVYDLNDRNHVFKLEKT
ncbi:DUF5615 family PIN-like protein [Microbulbifer epialgicus]|uniref:DUF5615 family PIN-like protein n=1 Tax=Microbulbifer epialgicus TaxID=393907 RepID=A0ABV4NV12_9GAMM